MLDQGKSWMAPTTCPALRHPLIALHDLPKQAIMSGYTVTYVVIEDGHVEQAETVVSCCDWPRSSASLSSRASATGQAGRSQWGVRASGRKGVVSNAKQGAGHEYIGLLCPQTVLTVN